MPHQCVPWSAILWQCVGLILALIIVIKFLGGGYVQQALVSLSNGNGPLCLEDKSTHATMLYPTCPKLQSNRMQSRRLRSGSWMNKYSCISPTTPKIPLLDSSKIFGKTWSACHQARRTSTSWWTGRDIMSQSRGLLLHFIVILTLPIWTLIKNSLYAQGWNPQHLSHECFELRKPWFFQPLCIQLRRKTSKGWKKWATQFSLQKSCYNVWLLARHVAIQMHRERALIPKVGSLVKERKEP